MLNGYRSQSQNVVIAVPERFMYGINILHEWLKNSSTSRLYMHCPLGEVLLCDREENSWWPNGDEISVRLVPTGSTKSISGKLIVYRFSAEIRSDTESADRIRQALIAVLAEEFPSRYAN